MGIVVKKIEKTRRMVEAIGTLTPSQPSTSYLDTIDGETVCIEVHSDWDGEKVSSVKISVSK